MTSVAGKDYKPTLSGRSPSAEVDPTFIERWSRRAISSAPLPHATVRTLFEAARWAPSASNSQPWLFVYASDAESLERGRALLKESNARWAVRAPLLVFVFARKRDRETGKALRTSAFDTGAAWFSLALQASRLGLVTRAMGGIQHEQVYSALNVPESEFESMVAIAVGYPASAEELPSDLAEREVPSQRKPQHEFVFAGRYRP